MKIKYIAADNKVFDNEKDCARHELANCAGVLIKLEKGISKAPSRHQMNWCGGGACACMGCINHEFYGMGLTKAHWEVWMEEFRQEIPMEQEPDWDSSRDCDQATLVLRNLGDNKASVLTAIKVITGLSTVESYKLLKPDSQIKIGIVYVDAKHYKKILETAGAKVEIMEYTPMKKIKIMDLKN